MLIKSNFYNSLNLFFAYVLIASVMSPIFSIFSLNFKIDVFLTIFCAFDVVINSRFYLRKKIGIAFLSISVLIFLLMLLSNNLGTLVLQDFNLSLPTEYLQVFSRVFCFLFMYRLFYDKFSSIKKVLKFLSFIFIVCLIIGVFQINDIISLNTIFSELYSANENQNNNFLKGGTGVRIFGVAGNPISWGGFSLFLLIFFYVLTNNKIKFIGVLLSLINIIFSVSKSAYLGLFVSILIFPILKVLIYKKNILFLLKSYCIILLVIGILLTPIFYFLGDNLNFILFRLNDFANSGISANTRWIQVLDSISLMFNNPYSFYIGVGKPMVYKILEYVEIEFIYLLVTYGFIGLTLHYSLLFFLIYYSVKSCKTAPRYSLFLILSTIAYLSFSIGFYFFRELNVGLSFWIVNGILFSLISKNEN
jgi:hypothetical protein